MAPRKRAAGFRPANPSTHPSNGGRIAQDVGLLRNAQKILKKKTRHPERSHARLLSGTKSKDVPGRFSRVFDPSAPCLPSGRHFAQDRPRLQKTFAALRLTGFVLGERAKRPSLNSYRHPELRPEFVEGCTRTARTDFDSGLTKNVRPTLRLTTICF